MHQSPVGVSVYLTNCSLRESAPTAVVRHDPSESAHTAAEGLAQTIEYRFREFVV